MVIYGPIILFLFLKRMSTFQRLCYLVLAVLLLCNCERSRKLSKENWARQYYGFNFESPIKHQLVAGEEAQHNLFLQIDPEEAGPYSYFQILISRFASLDEKLPFDTIRWDDIESEDGAFDLEIDGLGAREVLRIELLKKGETLRREKTIFVANESYRQLLIFDRNARQPIFDRRATVGAIPEVFQKQQRCKVQWLYLGQVEDLAPVPFAESNGSFEWKPSVVESPKDVGAYVGITQDSIRFPLLITEPYFPKLTAVADLVHCLRYVTKRKEYDKLLSSLDMEAAVDSFWMHKAGSVERGKILIKEFYGRVQRANAFFTELKPGWKTDRGLIYTIYGQPEVVLQKPNQEIWKYNAPIPNHPSGLMFTFDHKKNQYGLPVYQLQRSEYYEDSWHYVINEWRHGRISNVSY